MLPVLRRRMTAAAGAPLRRVISTETRSVRGAVRIDSLSFRLPSNHLQRDGVLSSYTVVVSSVMFASTTAATDFTTTVVLVWLYLQLLLLVLPLCVSVFAPMYGLL